MQCKVNSFLLQKFTQTQEGTVAEVALYIDDAEVDVITINVNNWLRKQDYEAIRLPVINAVQRALFNTDVELDSEPVLFSGE